MSNIKPKKHRIQETKSKVVALPPSRWKYWLKIAITPAAVTLALSLTFAPQIDWVGAKQVNSGTFVATGGGTINMPNLAVPPISPPVQVSAKRDGSAVRIVGSNNIGVHDIDCVGLKDCFVAEDSFGLKAERVHAK
jgi:hypothetical protein